MTLRGSTWNLDRFAGGIDLRDGLYSEDQEKLRRLLNAYIDHGGKIRRRPPCEERSGDFDAQTQGLLSIDGQKYSFAPKGTVVVHTDDVAAAVQTLYFDVPDLCSPSDEWELLAAQVFDGYAAALIRHTYPSTAYPNLVFLHVWDGLLYAPTYVQDPAFPGSFTPSIADLTDQEYDAEFTPVLSPGVTKLWTSDVAGESKACRTADPRAWNERTKDSLLEDGEWWCFVVPEGQTTLREFLVARDAATLVPDQRWAYYVLEYATDDGAWLPMEEVAIVPIVDFTWRPVSIVSRFSGGWNEIKIQVCWGQADAGLIRLRLVAGDTSVEIVTQPTVTKTAGSGTTWNIHVGKGKYRWRGGEILDAIAFADNIPSSAKTYLLGVAGGGFAELVDITSAFPNGWEREHRRFYKRIEMRATTSGNTAHNTPDWDTYPAITGTVTVTSPSVGILGSGTTFLTDLSPGDLVMVNGEIQTIDSVADDTHADIVGIWANPAAGVTIGKRLKHYARHSGGETQIKTNLTSGIAVGDNLRINATDFEVRTVLSSGIYEIGNSSGAAGNYTATVDASYSVTLTPVPLITDYTYAFDAGTDGVDSEWYTDRIVEYIDQAGAEDALTIATASHDNTGGKISAIATVRNRMLVCYPGSCQLWLVDQATSATQFLDSLSFGTGDQEFPAPVPFYGTIIIPTPTGWRSMNVVGANTDTLQDTNIGEPIQPLAMPVVRDAVFWPWYGQYIAVGTDEDGSTRFMCLDYSKESKISAWSQWAVEDLPEVDRGSFVVEQNFLYFRSGGKLRCFNAEATVFADAGEDVDDPEGPYLSDVLWHYNDFGRPGTGKRLTAFDIVQEGKSILSICLPPFGSPNDPFGAEMGDVPVSGMTYGHARRGIGMVAQAVAPRLRSRDTTGWKLQRLALDYINLRR